MKRIEINIQENDLETITKISESFGIPLDEFCARILNSYSEIYRYSPSYKAALVVKNSLFDELKIIMDTNGISQIDLANYLKISQAAVSYSLNGNNLKDNSKLSQALKKYGVNEFSLLVLSNKYFLLGDGELYKNQNFYSDIEVSKWGHSKKVFFGFCIYKNEKLDFLAKIIDKASEDEFNFIKSFSDASSLNQSLTNLLYQFVNTKLLQ